MAAILNIKAPRHFTPKRCEPFISTVFSSMPLTIQQTNSGLVAVTVPALPEQYRPYLPPARLRPPQTIRRFSPCARRRFKYRLQRTFFHPSTIAAFTFDFPPDTSPQRAKGLFLQWARWLRAKLPTSYGFYSVEFKNGIQIHYHLILGFPPDRAPQLLHSIKEIKLNWKRYAKLPDNAKVYGAPVKNLGKWLYYLSKGGRQRTVPDRFHREMTRFWGIIGDPPESPKESVTLTEDQVINSRPVIAEFIAKQGRPRSAAYAQAIRCSWRPKTVMLSPHEVGPFLGKLTALDQGSGEAA